MAFPQPVGSHATVRKSAPAGCLPSRGDFPYSGPMSEAINVGLTPVAGEGQLYNADLAPVPLSARKWRTGSFAALWISMSACIPTYMLASSLIGGGMNWWQAVLTIFLGNLIVLVPMILNRSEEHTSELQSPC